MNEFIDGKRLCTYVKIYLNFEVNVAITIRSRRKRDNFFHLISRGVQLSVCINIYSVIGRAFWIDRGMLKDNMG